MINVSLILSNSFEAIHKTAFQEHDKGNHFLQTQPLK
jgi:hypothetical protein